MHEGLRLSYHTSFRFRFGALKAESFDAAPTTLVASFPNIGMGSMSSMLTKVIPTKERSKGYKVN